MRTLLLLRGAPGSGKSTWIRENNLEQYALEADRFRNGRVLHINTVYELLE